MGASIWGDVILTRPPSLALLTGLALCTSGALGALLVCGHYARHETIRGVLSRAPEGGPDAPLVRFGAGLHADLYLPTRALRSLAPGQQIWLHYDAFPQGSFGSFRGLVREINDGILLPGDPHVPVSIGESVHRATVDLAEHEVVVDGRQVPLRAGMRVSAEISLERRSLLEWLLGPLCKIRKPKPGGRHA